jgi:hypothetical protein
MNDVIVILIIAAVVFIVGAVFILCRASAMGARAEEELWHQECMLKDRISAASERDDDSTVTLPVIEEGK